MTHRDFLYVGLLLLTSALVQAAPRHAITLYDELPKYPEHFSHFDYVHPNPPQGGVLRRAGFGSFDSLNPFINKGIAADQIGLIYDSLTVQSLDEPFTEYGLIAKYIERASDNSWVRFYLRPEARFHDGRPITAEDVVFTFDTLTREGAPQYRSYYAEVAEVVVENPLQVRFVFKKEASRELALILGQLPVLPKHWWQGRDFNKTDLTPPLGSGPYQVATLEAGRSISYQRTPNWWGKDLPVSRGFYNFERISVEYYRDNTIALEAFKTGRFDFWLEMSAKNWATAYDIPALRTGALTRTELPNHNPTGMQGFIFNTRKEVFQDVRVRRALSLLFDFEWTNKKLFNGAYSRTTSYFENSELAAQGMPSAGELLLLEPLRGQIPESVFGMPQTPSVTDGSGIIRPQQRAAYQLLLEAGWRVVDDHMVDAKGHPVVLEFMLAQTELERVLLPYKRNLEELGIGLEIRRVDVSQYINRLRSRDFDMIVGNFPQSNSPGNEQREYWHSSSAERTGSRNLIGVRNRAIDRIVEGLIQADSRQALMDHTRALDRLLLAGHYVVPNWYIKTWRVAYWDTLEHPATLPPYDFALMAWWHKASTSAAHVPAKEP